MLGKLISSILSPNSPLQRARAAGPVARPCFAGVRTERWSDELVCNYWVVCNFLPTFGWDLRLGASELVRPRFDLHAVPPYEQPAAAIGLETFQKDFSDVSGARLRDGGASRRARQRARGRRGATQPPPSHGFA